MSTCRAGPTGRNTRRLPEERVARARAPGDGDGSGRRDCRSRKSTDLADSAEHDDEGARKMGKKGITSGRD